MDRGTRKEMTMNGALQPGCMSAAKTEDGGRGFISVEDAVGHSILGLENYVSKST